MTGVDPANRRLLYAIRFFVIPGFLAATYLSYAKIFHKAVVCATGGCETIQASKWSELFGIPVTLIGMIAYIVIFSSTFVKHDNAKLLGAFTAVCGACFSLWLQYQALFVMKHFCQYCFTSAICMIVLAGLTIYRVLRLPPLESYLEPDGEPAAT